MKNSMKEKNACISVYLSCQAAEQALEKLQKAGIDLQKVSIIGKGYHGTEHPVGFYCTNGRIYYRGGQGAFWADLWDSLAGAAFFWLPGFGPLAAAGPIVRLLVSGLEGVAIGGGFGVLGAALFDMGVPRNSIIDYEQAVNTKKLILIVNDGRDPVEHACKILHDVTQQVTVHRA